VGVEDAVVIKLMLPAANRVVAPLENISKTTLYNGGSMLNRSANFLGVYSFVVPRNAIHKPRPPMVLNKAPWKNTNLFDEESVHRQYRYIAYFYNTQVIGNRDPRLYR
jgi:hypothetical protein